MNGVVLAVDYGLARVGLARTDPTRTLVSVAGSLARSGDRRLAEAIARIAREVEAVEIVIGLPLRDDGASTPVIDGARRLARHLVRLTKRPVAFVDESLSSLAADQLGSEVGRGDRDQRAAATILERYLAEGAMEVVES